MQKIREFFKQSTFITSLYRKVFAVFVATLIKCSPYLATKFLYRRRIGKPLNLKNPSNFNEKIQWLKLYWRHPLVVKCGDKYEVRNYVKELGFTEILLKTHGVYRNTEEIDWDILPDKFAMKVTSGCGYNIICKDKKQLNINEIKSKLKNWMKTNYSLKYAEIHYEKMTPRILCEEFINTCDGTLPVDYKIYCFNGKPKIILVTTERESGYKRYFFDTKWNILELEKGTDGVQVNMKKPKSLESMLYYAEKLSEPFPFVRVDFYDYNGKPILGEMTFTPAGGMANYYKESSLEELGDLITLPEKIYS